MKKPRPNATAIDMKRVSRWLTDFMGYRYSITEARIDRWLGQFRNGDRDLAARVLDSVDFIPRDQMVGIFRDTLASLDGWNVNKKHRVGRWRFVAFSSTAGESGDEMLRLFRSANKLSGKQYGDLFIHRSELLASNLGPNDTVVFVDDFAGTGTQISNAWPEMIELLPGHPRVFLVLIAAGIQACNKIEKGTDLILLPAIRLRESDNIFSDRCGYFTADDKIKLLRYCCLANNKNPKGFGDCGFLFVLASTCPNNSIPILHAYHDGWEGLFRRHD